MFINEHNPFGYSCSFSLLFSCGERESKNTITFNFSSRFVKNYLKLCKFHDGWIHKVATNVKFIISLTKRRLCWQFYNPIYSQTI